MKLIELAPRKALNKAFLKVKPSRIDIEIFKTKLSRLIEKINEDETEEFHKNLVSQFLRETYYGDKYFINTKGRNDLVIHTGRDAYSPVGVILEAKKPANAAEMLRKNNINTKAFQELALYYMRERITAGNLEIKYLIATNIYEWFIFDAAVFEKAFARNSRFVKLFNDFETGRLVSANTDFFYKQVAEPEIAAVENDIIFTHFDIRDYEEPLRNADKRDDNKLIALYKLLSPEHLLKLPFANDSNSLDKTFYSELLHIIGLTETKNGGKKLIERKPEGGRDPGALLENAVNQLDSLDKIARLPNPRQFGETQPERLFNAALELVITWINRVLFLKLLEAQLIKYHRGDDAFAFLNTGRVPDYDALNSLFFQALARKPEERGAAVKKLFANVPYLNSSLFEPTELEHSGVFISQLSNEKIPVLASTVLKDERGRKKSGSMDTLEYLFEFLNAYDFSSEGSEDIQEDNKALINASVLGLIFEKINGYKDGSFFTPGFITMYMCRETIRRAVVQKFNAAKGWNCENLDQVFDKITDKPEANAIINSLKICDPAVGSGHFLVSALNEIIAVKSDLKILLDRQNRTLRDYQLEVVNDELIITDDDGKLFEYNPNNKESQRVQETLFHEKQTIIESCLFGVDINPNSVKICRLRLWIELLKNAYYKAGSNYTELETLPNIDINIKCGNSLISRYALDTDIKKALRKSKWTIASYRFAVMAYRNAANKDEKRAMEKIINDIKTDFETEINHTDKRSIRAEKLGNELNTLLNQRDFFEISKAAKSEQLKKVKKLTADLQKLETEIETIKSNKIYENAFEWRFEFPEVLNDDGEFVGFDIVIGNPPYGVSIKNDYRKSVVNYLGKVPDYEIYYFFIEISYKLLNFYGINSYIIPNTFLFNVFASEYRNKLLNSWSVDCLIDCTAFKIFEEATILNAVTFFIKSNKTSEVVGYKPTCDAFSFLELANRNISYIEKSLLLSNNQNWGLAFKLEPKVIELILKIKANSITLDSVFPEYSQGLIAYDKYRGQSSDIIESRSFHYKMESKAGLKKWLWGEDVTRYKVTWNGKEWVDYCDGIANPRKPYFFNGPRLLVREITNPSIFCAFTDGELYHDPSIIVVRDNKYKIHILLGILNSKLATFYHFNSSPKATKGAFPKILVEDIKLFPLKENLPDKIGILAKYITKLIDENQAKMFFDQLIDAMVYELYFSDEIKTADAEVLKNLTDLPDLKDDWNEETKLEIIENVYKDISEPKHPVSIAMAKQKTVPAVRIIEGLDKT